MRKFLQLSLIVGVLAASVGISSPATATFHEIQITEVFTGVGSAPNAQYVELTTEDDGQNQVEDKQVQLYDANGALVATATFADDVADAEPAQSKILVGTTEAANFFGVSMDATFSANTSIDTGGKACFLAPAVQTVDCVSWGSYTGDSRLTGTPISVNEGIPAGAAIERVISRGNETTYDSADDHDNSARDFELASPVPDGGGTPSVTLQRIGFTFPGPSVNEDATSVNVPISRSGATGAGPQAVTYFTIDGTAAGNVDYTPVVDEEINFAAGDGAENRFLPIADDSLFEGPETVKLRVRNPTNGAVLGDNMNGTLTINDLEDDSDPPTSRITRPDHRETYNPGMDPRGTSNDGPATVAQVLLGLRQKRTNGSCKWFNGERFVARPCSSKKFVEATLASDGDWDLPLADPLPRSVGTRVKFYTAYSKAKDEAGLVETGFEVGRNANKFEIK